MDILNSIFNGIISLNSTVFIAIMFFLITLLVKAGFQTAVRSALYFGGGLVGINAIMSVTISVMTPIAQGISEKLGTNLSVVDVGYGAFPASWAWPGAMICFFIFFAISFALVALKLCNTVLTDPHNIWHCMWFGLMAYALTGNMWLGVAIAIVIFVISLYLADHYAKSYQEFNEIPNITLIAGITNLTLAFAYGCMKIINKIPGLKDVEATADDLKEKFGVFGEVTTIGFILGFVLSLIAGTNVSNSLYQGIALGATLALYPRVAGFLLEGIVPMTTAITNFMKEKFPGRNINITVDVAVIIGHPSVMSSFCILVPISVILCTVLPGVSFIPIASLAGVPYFVGAIAPATKGNLAHTVIIGTLWLVICSYVCSWTVNEFTATLQTAGYYVDQIASGTLMTCWDEGGNFIALIVKWICGFFS